MNWNQVIFPSLHHGKEGWLRHQENFAQRPKQKQPGWFSVCSQSENHPGLASAEASRNFIDRSASPPCSDARRGINFGIRIGLVVLLIIVAGVDTYGQQQQTVSPVKSMPLIGGVYWVGGGAGGNA